MNRLLLVIILCLTSISYAQNHKIIYQHILHPNIINNEGTLKLAASIIEEEAKLNPEMIYFRVHFLNEIYGNKNISNETNGKKELDIARRKYIVKRNSWLENQIVKIKSFYGNKHGVEKVLSFFEELKVKQPLNFSFNTMSVDDNKIDFFAVFYISKGTVNKYNNSVQYSKLRKELENNELKKIISLTNSQNNKISLTKDDIYSEIKKNMHIIVNRSGIDFGKVLLEKELDDYSINNLNNYGIGLNYSSNLVQTKNDIEIFHKYSPSPLKFGAVTALKNFSIEISFKLFFKKFITSFSYIDASIFYSNYSSSYELPQKEFYNSYSLTGRQINNQEEFVSLNYKNIEIKNRKFFDLGIKLLTPIWVITPNLICELGGILYYQIGFFEINYLYDYRNYMTYYVSTRFGNYRYSKNISQQTNVEEKENSKNSKFNASPIVSFKYINIFNHLDIVLTTDLHYYSTGIRLTY